REIRQQRLERGVVELVMAEREHGFDVANRQAIDDGGEYFQRQAGDADVPDPSGPLESDKRGDRFIHDLLDPGELHVMALQQVDVVDADANAALVEALSHAGGREVELALA